MSPLSSEAANLFLLQVSDSENVSDLEEVLDHSPFLAEDFAQICLKETKAPEAALTALQQLGKALSNLRASVFNVKALDTLKNAMEHDRELKLVHEN